MQFPTTVRIKQVCLRAGEASAALPRSQWGSSTRLLRGARQVQLLSHQSKIAKRVYLFVGEGVHVDACRFKRLGYVSLDSNERSSYQVRPFGAGAAGWAWRWGRE